MSAAEKIILKKQLHAHCIAVLESRLATAREAMQQSQEAANNEEKSSAGDKYETSRTMGQLGRDMYAKQADEAQRDLAFIQSVSPETENDFPGPGSVVVCSSASFFISLGLGQAEIAGQKFILVSPNAPVAVMLREKKSGDRFQFAGKELTITEIF